MYKACEDSVSSFAPLASAFISLRAVACADSSFALGSSAGADSSSSVCREAAIGSFDDTVFFCLLIALWYYRSRSAGAVIVLSGAMILFLASGVAGAVLHYKGNVVYEQESNPGLGGRELYRAAVQGSTPTLAPGAMIQLGLLGLIVAFCGSRLSHANTGVRHTQTKRAEP